MQKFNTPIVISIYKRGETLNQLLIVLAKLAPSRIFIIADGPKKGEESQVEEVRSLIDSKIMWSCKIEKIYATKNMGLAARIRSGLNEVFSKVDRVIILEDDCIPDLSFFYFCESMLSKYEDESQVLSITGDNFLKGRLPIKESYYFSTYFHSWGWATWKRAWKLFDYEMVSWPEKKKTGWLSIVFENTKDKFYWSTIFDLVKTGRINSWAYRWTYTHFKNRALSIVPSKNLVTNIGFGLQATNTVLGEISLSLASQKLRFPLVHPREIKANKNADIITAKNIYTTPKNLFVVMLKKIFPFS